MLIRNKIRCQLGWYVYSGLANYLLIRVLKMIQVIAEGCELECQSHM